MRWSDELWQTPFETESTTRVVYGCGVVQRLGELVRTLPGERLLLVTDPGIEQAGHITRCVQVLQAAGYTPVIFDQVQPNPTTDDVERGVAVAQRAQIELLIAVGGGSAMDCAKGINFLYTNGGKMADYWGTGKARLPMLPMIAVPTTAGTGSEAQSYALIADARTHQKMACGDKKAACRIALLDPELTLSMPPRVTSATGLDAISHAVESYVTRRRHAWSQMLSRRAWQLLAQSFPRVLADPQSLAARSGMLLGAHWAGAAIENSMLGAAHALANPLTAHFDITHGWAVAVMLPHVVRYNGRVCPEEYAELAADLPPNAVHALDDAVETLAQWLQRVAYQAGCPPNLRSWGVTERDLPLLAAEAARQWTGSFNPRPVDAPRLEELYRCALDACPPSLDS
ncbi:MAG: iron alcohol dehydrogenase [Planctomycetaceae bacterium]|nr:MAG: iron alcohol dehydrogenase [Planctomycetaceae bacterium]